MELEGTSVAVVAGSGTESKLEVYDLCLCAPRVIIIRERNIQLLTVFCKHCKQVVVCYVTSLSARANPVSGCSIFQFSHAVLNA